MVLGVATGSAGMCVATFHHDAEKYLRRRGRMIALGALGALAMLAGCAPSAARQGTTPSAMRAATAFPTFVAPATATPLAPPARTQTLAQAWGAPHITRLLEGLPNDEMFVFENAATPDGQWLVGEIEPRDLLDNQTVIPAIALYNVTTGAMRSIQPLQHPQSQIEQASTDGRWLMWSEAVSQQSPFDWRIYICDLQSGATRLLAQAPRVNGQPDSGPNGGPVISNGRVVWSQPLAPVDANDLRNIGLKMEDLSSGVVSTVATGVGEFTFSWPWVAWTQADTSNNELSVENLATHALQRLTQTAAAPTLDGSSLAYNYYTYVNLISDVSDMGAGQTIYTPPPGSNAHPVVTSLSARLIAWSDSSYPPIPLLFDRAEGVYVTLPASASAPVYQAWTSDTLLVWSEGESSVQRMADAQKNLAPLSTLCVVQLASLPQAGAAA